MSKIRKAIFVLLAGVTAMPLFSQQVTTEWPVHPFLQQVIQVMKNVQHLPLVKLCVVVDPAPYFWI